MILFGATTAAGRGRFWLRALCCAIGFLLAPARVSAHPRSELEQSIVDQTLADRKLRVDESPEGKTVEAIVFERLPVFDGRDPVPDFLNVLHGTSREAVLERELLFAEGQRWSTQRIEETERNLRGRRQLSLVLIVAARGSSPDRVVVVIITKDVWSLRLNSDFALGPGGLEYVLLNPAEENAFGTWISLGLLYRYEPARQMLGGRFIAPRYFGTRYYLGAQAAPIFRNSDFALEGSSGQIIFERPQFSLRTEYAFGARIAWLSETSRRMLQTEVRDFVYVDPDTREESRVPWQYQTERYAAEYYGIVSRGLENKRDLLFGLELDSRRFSTPFSYAPAPGVERAFVDQVLPVSDRRLSPFVQLRVYEARFLRTVGLELLGLQEDYRLGIDLLARFFVGSQVLGSSRDHFGSALGAGYTWPLGNGLVRFVVSNRLVLGNEQRNEGASFAAVRVTSPTFGSGRVHLLVEGVGRYFDYLNVAPYGLGGDGVLRGYRSGEFLGKNYALGSAEYRSGSVDILSAQVGFAFFVDVGAAANDPREFSFRSSLGTGLRILFPQADRAVLRVDVGVPLEVEPGRPPAAIFATFGQAFGMPGLTTPSVTSGVGGF